LEEAIRAYRKYQGSRKNPRLNFKTFFKVYAKENFASGGRVPLGKGKLVTEGLPAAIAYLRKKFGKDIIKKGSQLGKSEKVLEREMFERFNKKLKKI